MPTHWRALLPGAALFGVGHAALQVATAYYFAPKLARGPALYGSLRALRGLLAGFLGFGAGRRRLISGGPGAGTCRDSKPEGD